MISYLYKKYKVNRWRERESVSEGERKTLPERTHGQGLRCAVCGHLATDIICLGTNSNLLY